MKDGHPCLGLRVVVGCWCVPRGHSSISLFPFIEDSWKRLQEAGYVWKERGQSPEVTSKVAAVETKLNTGYRRVCCFFKFVCQCPNPWYVRMWPYWRQSLCRDNYVKCDTKPVRLTWKGGAWMLRDAVCRESTRWTWRKAVYTSRRVQKRNPARVLI